MINQLINYKEAGRKAARARKNGDENLARFESDYASRMWSVENDQDRKKAMQAFNQAYKDFNHGYRGP